MTVVLGFRISAVGHLGQEHCARPLHIETVFIALLLLSAVILSRPRVLLAGQVVVPHFVGLEHLPSDLGGHEIRLPRLLSHLFLPHVVPGRPHRVLALSAVRVMRHLLRRNRWGSRHRRHYQIHVLMLVVVVFRFQQRVRFRPVARFVVSTWPWVEHGGRVLKDGGTGSRGTKPGHLTYSYGIKYLIY